jgi:ElaB/YqjD/DUF883 family membrane-anchored ribosome-binding protein
MELSLLETYKTYENEALILRSDLAMDLLLKASIGLQFNKTSINTESYEMQLLRHVDLLTVNETSITLSKKGQEFLSLLGIESGPVELSEEEERQALRTKINNFATQADDYRQKIADAAMLAKEYVADKSSAISDKIEELRNKDFREVAEDAKEYVRQNPGQSIIISAAAGFIIALLARSRRP